MSCVSFDPGRGGRFSSASTIRGQDALGRCPAVVGEHRRRLAHLPHLGTGARVRLQVRLHPATFLVVDGVEGVRTE